MTAYNQEELINQLNRFLAYKQNPFRLQTGYCHGLTLIWLHKMSKGKEDQFYATVKAIIDCKDDADFDRLEKNIAKFIRRIEWLQNADEYEDDVQQLDVDKLLKTSEKFSLSYLFNRMQLSLILDDKVKKHNMVCISSPCHSIGVYKRGKQYYLYDANFDEGIARVYKNIIDLELALLECLYELPTYQSERYQIDINITSYVPMKKGYSKTDLYTYLVKSTDAIDEPMPNETTNLFMACECQDEKEIEILLQHGANANQFKQNGITPLYYTADKKHTASARLLLKYGASPLQARNNGVTPLSVAMLNENWSLVASMLIYINHSKDISLQDIFALYRNKEQILLTISQLWSGFSAKEKNHLKSLMGELYQMKYRQGFFYSKTNDSQRKKLPRLFSRLFHKKSPYEELSLAGKQIKTAGKTRLNK